MKTVLFTVLAALAADATTAVDVLKQLIAFVPTTIVAASTLTSTIRGLFNIKSDKWIHAINWILGAGVGACFVACNGLDFGVATWLNYVLGVLGGVLGAAASNGIYDWDKVSSLLQYVTDFFYNIVHKNDEPKETESASDSE